MMRTHLFLLLAGLCMAVPALHAQKGDVAPTPTYVYGYTLNDIDGKPQSMQQYKGKVMIFLNVASKCGYTDQYADWQKFYEAYADKGVVVLGIPANNFMKQEPGSSADIKTFCSLNYGVTFPMFEKISVKGKDIHPLYKYFALATREKISWNFNKVIVDKEGKPRFHFTSKIKPTDPEFLAALNQLLSAK
jgi:glutathione peroxidase-family protein